MMFTSQNSPYIIAELSGNHNGDIQRAKQLITEAAKAGANCVKLQTYTPDSMTLNADTPDFTIQGGLWDGRTLWDLYEEAHTPYDWHAELFDHAAAQNITCISSPFDEGAVDFLETLNCPFYKIASFEMTDLPLVRHIAKTGKPVIMSTGMASLNEIDCSMDVLKAHGCGDVTLLHCISGYPTPINQSNLKLIKSLQARYGDCIGLSDHTLGNMTALLATALGVKVIEKHFTIRREDGGPDAAFSMEPHELESLVKETSIAYQALGDGSVVRSEVEMANKGFRRSLYAARPIKAGETFTKQNLRRVRPGFGLAPEYFDRLIGTECRQDIGFAQAIELHHTELES